MDAIAFPLECGATVLLDKDDIAIVSVYRWRSIRRESGTLYAGTVNVIGRVWMHNLLCETDGIVDHVNGNGLDNRRRNLRAASVAQNAWNKRKQNGTYSSRFKGVHLRRDTGRYRAHIEVNKRRIIIGNFSDEVAAALAYDKAATELYGEFARLNFPVHNNL